MTLGGSGCFRNGLGGNGALSASCEPSNGDVAVGVGQASKGGLAETDVIDTTMLPTLNGVVVAATDVIDKMLRAHKMRARSPTHLIRLILNARTALEDHCKDRTRRPLQGQHSKTIAKTNARNWKRTPTRPSQVPRWLW